MKRRGATVGRGVGFCSRAFVATMGGAQMRLPEAKPRDGAALFKQQCATCHTTNLSDATRQGPSLFGIIGRRVGTSEGFHYSADFAKADFVCDEARLDAWMINPQAMIPSAVMPYRPSKPEIRAAVIGYLQELHSR